MQSFRFFPQHFNECTTLSDKYPFLRTECFSYSTFGSSSPSCSPARQIQIDHLCTALQIIAGLLSTYQTTFFVKANDTDHRLTHRIISHPLCDETKNLTDTDTETFIRDQIFRYRYRDFLSETKFSETDTETFFPRPNFPIPIPRLFF